MSLGRPVPALRAVILMLAGGLSACALGRAPEPPRVAPAGATAGALASFENRGLEPLALPAVAPAAKPSGASERPPPPTARPAPAGTPEPGPGATPREAQAPAEATRPAASGDGPRPSARGSEAAEARLLAAYRLIGEGRLPEARAQAEALVRDMPHFQLGQLLLADLWMAHSGPLPQFGAAPRSLTRRAENRESLDTLRAEARQRLQALQERPPAGRVPSAFLALPPDQRHVIAIDSSRHRLYLFEQDARGLRLVRDLYVSVGKAGIDKRVEGDQRTPIGVYFVTGRPDPKRLGDLYGAGALSLDYPSPLDRLKGRTGSGIWLHGSPAAQFVRAPQSTDGCVVMANPDMQALLRQLAPRGTPVLIARSLDWVEPLQLERGHRGLGAALQAWWRARDQGDEARLSAFYAGGASFVALEASGVQRVSTREAAAARGRHQAPRQLLMLGWRDELEHAVVSFEDPRAGQSSGPQRRQYWTHDGQRWRIVHEAVLR